MISDWVVFRNHEFQENLEESTLDKYLIGVVVGFRYYEEKCNDLDNDKRHTKKKKITKYKLK